MLMKHIKVTGDRVMGSAHLRLIFRVKIYSLCFNLGLSSLFLIINPVVINNPVALYFTDVALDHDKVMSEVLGTSSEREKIIAAHPVATAKFFNYLIKSILKYLVIGSVLDPNKAYFGIAENQDRGSGH